MPSTNPEDKDILNIDIKDLKFPKDFLWGGASSSHQVEGGQNNDWSEFEKEKVDQMIINAPKKFGKLPIWKDIEKEATSRENYISGMGCDHYHRFAEDFAMAKDLGHNTTRFSIEWSRIEPNMGQFDENEIAHYQSVIDVCRENGIEPFVTLWHWSNPLWIRDIGDWSNDETVEHFTRYVEKISSVLTGVKYWITVNEPNIHTSFAYIKGTQPPGKKNIFKAYKAFKNILRAHKLAYAIIHKNQENCEVGFSNSVLHFDPKSDNFINHFIARASNYFWNIYPLKFTEGTNDFLGVNYYSRNIIGFGDSIKLSANMCGDLGWEIYPKGIYLVVKMLSKFNLPIYITENGLADAKDTRRADFIKSHLFWLKRAIDEGADVRGYLHWSLLDNFEFVELRGFWPRFGLIEVDFKTLERKVRPSALVYRDIIKNSQL